MNGCYSCLDILLMMKTWTAILLDLGDVDVVYGGAGNHPNSSHEASDGRTTFRPAFVLNRIGEPGVQMRGTCVSFEEFPPGVARAGNFHQEPQTDMCAPKSLSNTLSTSVFI